MPSGGNVSTVGSLLKDVSSLSVPDFQRNYSWEDSNIDDFHKDVLYAQKMNKPHFIGAAILLIKSSPDEVNKNYEVIDGQQRLTTIFMYLAILRDFANSYDVKTIDPPSDLGSPINVVSEINGVLFSDPSLGIPRFQSNRLLKSMFYESIIRHPGPNRPPLPQRDAHYSLKLRKAYARLKTLTSEHLNKFGDQEDRLGVIYKLFSTVVKQFQMLSITTSTYPESFDIFMTLNSRGKTLGPSDLVKSLFMKFLTADESVERILEITEDISNQWEDVLENLGAGDIDQFLRHYLLSIQREEPVQSKNIYNTVQNMVEKAPSIKQECRTKLHDIVETSGFYAKLLEPTSIENPDIRTSCIAMQHVLDSYRIFLLGIVDGRIDIPLSDRKELARLAEVLSLRWTMVRGNAQELEDHFQELSGILRDSNNKLNDCKEYILRILPTDSQVEPYFYGDSGNSSIVRVVLYRINYILGDQSQLIAYDPRKMHVEHIAPATPTEIWKSVFFGTAALEEVQSEYSALVEQWGNKTILEKGINLQIKQRSFSQKRDGDRDLDWLGYTNSILVVTNDLRAIDQWNDLIIKKRNRWIKDCFFKIWAASPKPNSVKGFSEWLEVDE